VSRRQTLEILASASPADVQVRSLENEDHLVFPVVALIGNSVIQASNAPAPEYIPLDVIISSLSSWGSRPVICGAKQGHPKKNNRAVSAIDPEIFSSSKVGTIFNPSVNENGKLIFEVWVSLERCAEIGGDAETAREKIQSASEVINVSIGAAVEVREEQGSINGKDYSAVWESIEGDHLALLPVGLGACSVDMGCGAPRAMEAAAIEISAAKAVSVSKEIHIMENGEKSEKPANKPQNNPQNEDKRSLLSRFFSKFRSALVFDDGDSDQDLRQSLSKALKKVEPAFDWITAVYQETNVVVYMTYIVVGYSYASEYHYWRRTYSVGENGVVTLNNDAVEVYPKEVWETVNNSSNGSTVTTASEHSNSGSSSECSCQKGERNMSNEAKEKEDGKNVEPKVAAAETQSQSQPVQPVQITQEQILAALSSLSEEQILSARPELKAVVSKQRAAEEERKSELVKALTATGKLSEDKLKVRSLEDLEDMATLAGVGTDTKSPVDYSFRQAAELGTNPRSAESGWRSIPNSLGVKKAVG
jgi:hypothetical protein